MKSDAITKAMNVSSIDADLFDAVVRLVRLVEMPGQRKVLAPLITKEIIYGVLSGGQGARLSHILAFFSSVRVLRHRAFNQQIGYFLVRYENGVCELAKNLESEIGAQRMVNLERRIAVIKLVRGGPSFYAEIAPKFEVCRPE